MLNFKIHKHFFVITCSRLLDVNKGVLEQLIFAGYGKVLCRSPGGGRVLPPCGPLRRPQPSSRGAGVLWRLHLPPPPLASSSPPWWKTDPRAGREGGGRPSPPLPRPSALDNPPSAEGATSSLPGSWFPQRRWETEARPQRVGDAAPREAVA